LRANMSNSTVNTVYGLNPLNVYTRAQLAEALQLEESSLQKILAGKCRVLGRVPLIRLADIWDDLPLNTSPTRKKTKNGQPG